MSRGTTIGWRGCLAALAVAIGCGVATATSSEPAVVTAAAMAAASGQPPAPPADPRGPGEGGGALPVVPAHGGCIVGLDCGCIRGTTGPCSGPPLLKHPAIHNAPQEARSGGVDGHN